ncbi:MAG: homocysteine S-methyltransferase, partial [Alphaproteobacteria bacterium HGW-Alphaproteobacteria-13]
PPAPEAAEIYAAPVALIAPHVDLLLFETMSSVDQARGALLAAANAPCPVWLAVPVMDEDGTRLRSGEPVGALAPLLAEMPPAALLTEERAAPAADIGVDQLNAPIR